MQNVYKRILLKLSGEVLAGHNEKGIDFETVLFSKEEPGFWTCEEIAQANGCDFWTICEL